MYSPDISPQVHAYIISYLKKEMPNVFGKESKKRELIFRLPEIYVQLQREYQISAGDFPEVKAMQVLGAPSYNVRRRLWEWQFLATINA